jgi:hypothetical protein
MSDTSATAPVQPETPSAVAPEATAKAAPPAEAAKPAFNTDQLQSSTSRFTNQAWRLYHNNRKDLTFLQEAPIRASLNARTIEGGEELEGLLREAGVKEMSRKGNTLAFTGTFALIQTIIRHPQTLLLDAVQL